ncbi:hypothetical protein YUBABA_00400 [Serratia phage vB_SmaM-Yubaba]|nr:hypothetical protein SUREIYA_01980 [Serratia phage vB_SmaM-Sureiya]UQT03246.1 hypothetical protein YUBABA_00400 [Serratia phage vB_SmaM-Yubaba]
MKRLFPICNQATRDLFIHPSICQAWDIVDAEGYTSGEETSYLKPGKIKNLAKLCKPENVYFTVTEEPNPDTMMIDEIMIGIKDKDGYWKNVNVSSVATKLEKLNAAQWGLDGHVTVDVSEGIGIGQDGEKIDLGDVKVLNIPIKLRYDRATRALEFSSSATYDREGMEVLGLILDLEWRDAKVI